MNKPVASFQPKSNNDAGIEAISAYNQEGVICLRGAFDQEWLNVIEKGIGQYFEKNQSHNVIMMNALLIIYTIFTLMGSRLYLFCKTLNLIRLTRIILC